MQAMNMPNLQLNSTFNIVMWIKMTSLEFQQPLIVKGGKGLMLLRGCNATSHPLNHSAVVALTPPPPPQLVDNQAPHLGNFESKLLPF